MAVNLTFRNENYTKKELIFMSLNVSKGIAVAVVAFTLMTTKIPGIEHILHLILAFMVYGIATSTIAERYASKFLNHPK